MPDAVAHRRRVFTLCAGVFLFVLAGSPHARADAAPTVCVSGATEPATTLVAALTMRLPLGRIVLLADSGSPEPNCGWHIAVEEDADGRWRLAAAPTGGAPRQGLLHARPRGARAALARAAAIWVSDLIHWTALAPRTEDAPAPQRRRPAHESGARARRAAAAPDPSRARSAGWNYDIGAAPILEGSRLEDPGGNLAAGLLLRVAGGPSQGLAGVLRFAWARGLGTGDHDVDLGLLAVGLGWRLPVLESFELTVDAHGIAAPWAARGQRRRSGWRFGGGLGTTLTFTIHERVALFGDLSVGVVSPAVVLRGAESTVYRLGRWSIRGGVGLSVRF